MAGIQSVGNQNQLHSGGIKRPKAAPAQATAPKNSNGIADRAQLSGDGAAKKQVFIGGDQRPTVDTGNAQPQPQVRKFKSDSLDAPGGGGSTTGQPPVINKVKSDSLDAPGGGGSISGTPVVRKVKSDSLDAPGGGNTGSTPHLGPQSSNEFPGQPAHVSSRFFA